MHFDAKEIKSQGTMNNLNHHLENSEHCENCMKLLENCWKTAGNCDLSDLFCRGLESVLLV